MIHYLWWIPSLFIVYVLYAYLSYKNNIVGGKWFFIMWGIGIIPLWAFVSRVSKNLLFDGILFDFLMFMTYTIALGIISKEFIKFHWYNWVGFVSIICGFVLLKLKM